MAPWRIERGRVLSEGLTVAVFQAFIRGLPGGIPGGLVWINRAPLWRTAPATPPSALEAALAALRRHYVDGRRFYLRVAPPVAEAGCRPASPGLAVTDIPGWASARLDLAPPLAALRAGLRQKWRNGLNRGEREGMEILRGGVAFEAFVAAHETFVAEAGFTATVTPAFLRTLRAMGGPLEALVARRKGRVLGGVLIADYGDTAEYLAGNTSDEGRALNAGQVLLWQAVAAARERGRAWFDLGGMDEALTPPGIYRFKEGLGGIPYRLAAELEAVPSRGLGALTGRIVRARTARARGQGVTA